MESIYKSEAGAKKVLNQYRNFLKKWPGPKEHLKVPTREGETFVIANGSHSAPPLVLFHGAMTNSIIWIKDVELWSGFFRVFAVDVIGEPGLSAPSRPPFDSDAYALWIDDILDHLALKSASFVGASLGGWLALDYAARRSNRIDKLSVMCPAGIGKQKTGFFLQAMFLLMMGNRGKQKMQDLVFGKQAVNKTVEFRSFLEYMSTTQKHVRPRIGKLRVFSDEDLKKLTMPLLAIVGAEDVIFNSLETKERLEKYGQNATVHYLPKVGHSIINQTETILDFLRGG
ncbi:MAG: alpha/beta hydrolase [Acidobacteriota bacterium]